MRGAVIAARHVPDRLLHPLRARAARAALPSLSDGDHVLVLCHGNICRSPYAAAALTRALAHEGMSGVVVESAGFVGPGRPMPSVGLQLAASRGLDLAEHRAQLLSTALINSAALVLVMNSQQRAQYSDRARATRAAARPVLLLGDFDEAPFATRAIRDPWNQTASVFEDVFTRLDRCTAALGTGLGLQAVTSRPTVRSGA